MNEFKKVEYGFVTFGKFKGKRWADVDDHYLEFIISDECYTNQANKDIAKKEYQQRFVAEGQMNLFEEKP